MKTRNALALTVLMVALAACGGGGGGGVDLPPTDSVPDSASASTSGMLAWLKRLTAVTAQDGEALDASRFAPPQPDDAEPGAL